ncbi:hypothetical protein [Pontibacter brevis]
MIDIPTCHMAAIYCLLKQAQRHKTQTKPVKFAAICRQTGALTRWMLAASV